MEPFWCVYLAYFLLQSPKWLSQNLNLMLIGVKTSVETTQTDAVTQMNGLFMEDYSSHNRLALLT